MQSHHDVQGLIAALDYPDPEIRGRAAVALRTLEAVQAVPALQKALEDELDAQARKYIHQALGLIGQGTDVAQLAADQDLEGLIEALQSTQSETVILAVRALGSLGNRLAVEPLVMLFQNPTSPPDVRLAAAEALLDLKSAPAVVTLLGALRRDSWQVRRNAAAVLGQIQAIWAVKPLAEILTDPHPVVRRAAAAALKRIGTAEAMAVLRAQLTATGETSPVAQAGAPHRTERRAQTGRGQYRFDSTPSALSAPTKERTIAPDQKPDAKPAEVEVVKASPPHTTRPAVVRHTLSTADTSPGRPVLQPPPRRLKPDHDHADAPPAAAKETTSASPPEAESQETTPRRNPIARVIAFLRRRGEDQS